MATTQQDALREKFNNYRTDRDTLWLTIAPSYACNCRCPYCYEQDKHTDSRKMTPEIAQSICDFVASLHAQQHFSSLDVQWYGGEPTLCLDVVAGLSQKFIDWCEGTHVHYSAMMLSNGTHLDETTTAMLKQARINSVMLTIDGPSEIHNARRPAVDVADPYECIKRALACLDSQGIDAHCIMNVDKCNFALLPRVEHELHHAIQPAKLNDYAHTFGCGAFKQPEFDLFTHEEFAHAAFEYHRAHITTAAEIDALLQPVPGFCNGQRENYFVIDAYGDVYKCDGWMGDPSRRLFNIADGSTPVLNAITFDPFENERCATCDELEVCWGNCSWERELCGWPCHPLTVTRSKYEALRGSLAQTEKPS